VARVSVRYGLLLAVGVVGVGIVRLALFGWGPVAPDDARYLNVGLSILAGRGPLTPDGNVWLLRSPAYGVALALGARIVGGDPIEGARFVAAALGLTGFVLALRLAWSLGGPRAATGTAGALLATPIVWQLLATLRIDLTQTAGVLAVLLALSRPTARRWALAGALLGLTVLVKETILLLVALPLAWLVPGPAALPRRVWLRLAALYLGAAVLVAGWWWVFVYAQAGAIFPLNAVGLIERRDVPEDVVRITRLGILIVALLAASWLAVARRAVGGQIGARLLALAGACLVPPALYALANSLSPRNYAGLAILSAVALGVAATDIVGWLMRRLQRGVALPAAIAGVTARAPAIVALAALLVAVPLVVAAQREVVRPAPSRIDAEVASWLAVHAGPGDRVVMPFRLREVVTLDLGGQVPVVGLPVDRVRAGDDPADYVWIGLRGGQLFGYRRAAWRAALGNEASRFLVLVTPHALTPTELEPLLRSPAGSTFGLTVATAFSAGGDRATIYAVDAAEALSGAPSLTLHVAPEAALAWLDAADPSPIAQGQAVARLASAHAVIVGSVEAIAPLLDRLAGRTCVTPAGGGEDPDALRLAPPGDCGG
jgi:hypothetical protein